MDRKEIQKWVKDKHLIMTYQADPYMIHELEEWAKSRLQPAFLDWNFITLTQDKADFLQVLEAIESIGFMDTKRVLFLKNFRMKDRQMGLWSREDFLSLAEAASQAAPDTLIFLILEEADRRSKEYKTLAKTFHVIDTPRLTESQLHSHLKSYITEQKSRINDNLISYYIRICGYVQKDSVKTLLQLHAEVDKLLAWQSQGNALTKESMENLVLKEEDIDVFRLTDAIFEGRRKDALEWYQQLYEEKKTSAPIMGWINSTLSLLIKGDYLLKEGFSSKQIAAALGVHEFRMKKTMELLRKINRQEAMAMLNGNLDLEYKLKTGNLVDEVLGEIAILKMTSFINRS